MTFLDTAYFLALTSKRDALHDDALAWSGFLPGPVLTTEYVLWEVVNSLSDPRNRPKAHGLLRGIEDNPKIEAVPADRDLLRSGLTLHAERPDKYWSLTDCISFVVMRQAGINEALTSDHHFEEAGFVALLRQPPPAH